MQQPIVILGRTLTQSALTPPSLTCIVTPVDTPAVRTSGKGGGPVLIDKISLSCVFSGDYVTGTSTFAGTATASITASTPRVECEGKQMLTENDFVTVNCTGTVTTTAGGATAPGPASVTVTITDGVQKNVDANKA